MNSINFQTTKRMNTIKTINMSVVHLRILLSRALPTTARCVCVRVCVSYNPTCMYNLLCMYVCRNMSSDTNETKLRIYTRTGDKGKAHNHLIS